MSRPNWLPRNGDRQQASNDTGRRATDDSDRAATDNARRARLVRPRPQHLALVGLAALAAILYAWGSGNYLEIYYAAAVRSMSMNWHDFLFGAFDPAGTITLDKLPGAFWLQALSVRLFGMHAWALVLPQVVEGVLTVLVVYRAVVRLAGTAAGLVAAGIVLVSPATAALNRGNIGDTLMILLVALAANSTVSAITLGRSRHLLLAGFWVGLAFQAKMLEAWLILPALALVYVVAGSGQRWRRVLAVAGMGLVTVVVSLSWMTAVSLAPAPGRPYVDGSQDNSVFQQVFVYNGFGRVDQESPDQLASQSTGLHIGSAKPPPATWDRLLTSSLGLDTGWLIPASMLVLVAGLIERRKQPRTDLLRASLLLWGTWLLALSVVFSLTSTINSYYTAALSPPIAGLLATGAVLAWQHRQGWQSRLIVALAVGITGAYGLWLLPANGTGLPGCLKPVAIALSALGVITLCIPPRLVKWASFPVALFAAAALSMTVIPAVATASIGIERLGPFDTPFQRPVVTEYIWQFFGATPADVAKTVPTLEKVRNGAPYLMATQTSVLASTFIYDTGLEALPIGGFTGTVPSPTLPAIRAMIRRGDFHLVLQSPTTTDPRLVWIARHCISLGLKKGAGPGAPPDFAIYYCLPSSVAARG